MPTPEPIEAPAMGVGSLIACPGSYGSGMWLFRVIAETKTRWIVETMRRPNKKFSWSPASGHAKPYFDKGNKRLIEVRDEQVFEAIAEHHRDMLADVADAENAHKHRLEQIETGLPSRHRPRSRRPAMTLDELDRKHRERHAATFAEADALLARITAAAECETGTMHRNRLESLARKLRHQIACNDALLLANWLYLWTPGVVMACEDAEKAASLPSFELMEAAE